MDNKITLKKAVAFTFVFIFLWMCLLIKILGSSNVPIDVERNGYCKIIYGNEYKYSLTKEKCVNPFESNKLSYEIKNFRNICPKNNFLSTKFYSKCFLDGDNI